MADNKADADTGLDGRNGDGDINGVDGIEDDGCCTRFLLDRLYTCGRGTLVFSVVGDDAW